MSPTGANRFLHIALYIQILGLSWAQAALNNYDTSQERKGRGGRTRAVEAFYRSTNCYARTEGGRGGLASSIEGIPLLANRLVLFFCSVGQERQGWSYSERMLCGYHMRRRVALSCADRTRPRVCGAYCTASRVQNRGNEHPRALSNTNATPMHGVTAIAHTV